MRPTLPLASLLIHLARRGAHSSADHAAQRELAGGRLAGALPAGLELTWLGAAGFRLFYQGHTLLIDPYLTRLPLRQLLSRRVAEPDAGRVARHIDTADAVLVGHSHFDHALDVPLIARATGASVYGSRSTAHLMRLHGLAARAVEVEPYRAYEVGPFQITFVPSAHARLLFGVAVPMSGDITCDHVGGLTARAYGCGQVYSIHIRVGGATLYHLGSAELEDDAVIHRGVDILLAAIAGRGFSPRFLERVLRRLEPGWLVPHHHDDFFRPLDQPMELSFNVDLAGFVDDLRRLTPDTPIATLMPLQPVSGGSADDDGL
ncbi:MAG TPA: MBL fold metallo-hydrolase [Kofleriaceae bacterium]|nr:MBL fold metallo-hydrolase [Kofleriaceae bacterium]